METGQAAKTLGGWIWLTLDKWHRRGLEEAFADRHLELRDLLQ